MPSETYRALVAREAGDGEFIRDITELPLADLPDHPVLVRVAYSSLNYKDALSATGHKGVTRRYPHTPGIDAAGAVVRSDDARFQPGDEVLVTGFDLGMNTPGGFGEFIRVPGDWLVPRPEPLTLAECMMLGTAGLTAGLAVDRLTDRVAPADGEVLVTGATGGVGSVAVGLLLKLGYPVAAVSGKPDAADVLRPLGEPALLSREEALEGHQRPLCPQRWAGVVDTVGGDMLAAAVKGAQRAGMVVACGNALSSDLPLNVFPFILRGVTLTGIDSATSPLAWRREVWTKLAGPWRLPGLADLCHEVGLEGLDQAIQAILAGGMKGRTLIAHARH